MERSSNIPRTSTRRLAIAAPLALIGLVAAGCGGVTRATIATPPSDPPPAAAPAPVSLATPTTASAYGGVWTGQSVPTQCQESGGAIGVGCVSVPEFQQLRLRLAQAGSTASGVLELGDLEFAVSGTVAPDGTLTLSGAHSAATHTVLIDGWRSSGDSHRMSGTFHYSVVPADDELGTVTVTAVVEDLIRGS